MKCYKTSLALIFILLSAFYSYSQENTRNIDSQLMRKYEKLLNTKESNVEILKYCDPSFPEVNQKSKMEEYAKNHPPIPLIKNSGSADFDKAKLNSELYEWRLNNSFYPQFIPYHLFNSKLTIEDDILFYENAVEDWKMINQTK